MHFLKDVRFGLRTMAKNPVVTIVSVLTLGVGIGINALYSRFQMPSFSRASRSIEATAFYPWASAGSFTRSSFEVTI
jgi:hypothetical protein